MIDERLRALLVCPVCLGELKDAEASLVCERDALSFAVVNGIPNMIAADATPLS